MGNAGSGLDCASKDCCGRDSSHELMVDGAAHRCDFFLPLSTTDYHLAAYFETTNTEKGKSEKYLRAVVRGRERREADLRSSRRGSWRVGEMTLAR